MGLATVLLSGGGSLLTANVLVGKRRRGCFGLQHVASSPPDSVDGKVLVLVGPHLEH